MTVAVDVATMARPADLTTGQACANHPVRDKHKYYARGVGLVGEMTIMGDGSKVDLVEVREPGS
jgi:hypothetical protein